MNLVRSFVIGLGLCAAGGLTLANAASQQLVQFDVPQQPLSSALNVFAQQSNLRMIFYTDVTAGMQSPAVHGSLTPEGALKILLGSANLSYEFYDNRTVSIWSPAERVAAGNSRLTLAQAGAGQPSASSGAGGTEAGRRAASASGDGSTDSQRSVETPAPRGIPEVLVKGSRVLNMDVRRTRDDAQPYVIFDRRAIEESGASTVDELLRQRLTMNTQSISGRQTNGAPGNLSEINLRGLGAAQTLILVDGHRVAGLNSFTTPHQPDINGIPLSAIERIEILPTTASGIYGGSATGGVVNVVLRRDYSGVEAKLTYGSSFSSDAAQRRADVSAGFALEGGKTSIMFAGSWAEDNELLTKDRDFLTRQRETILANNSGSYTSLGTRTAPPLSATTNIISSNGSNLTLKGSNRPLGSPITYVPVGYRGLATDGSAPLVANAGQYNLDLAPTKQASGGEGFRLLGEPSIKSGMLTVRRQFSETFEAFIDTAASRNTAEREEAFTTRTFTVNANAPNNPFNQALRVTVPLESTRTTMVENEDRRVVGGVIVRLPANWIAELDHTWNKATYEIVESPLGLTSSVSAPISNGTLNVLQDLTSFPPDLTPFLQPTTGSDVSKGSYVIRDTVLRGAGPLFSLPAGPIVLTALAERREETLDPFIRNLFNGPTMTESIVPGRKQTVNSGYLELQIPFFSKLNAVTGVQSFDIQIAGRRDEYTTIGGTTGIATTARNEVSSTDPTFGLRYSPVQSVMLRASYGTGFLPPAVGQLVPQVPTNVTLSGTVDPLRNNAPVTVVETTRGGNPDLRPEESESWSAGLVFTPSFVTGLRLSVDYTRIRKTDNIGGFGSPQELINSESLFPGVVIRDAPAAGQTVGRIRGIDQRLINISRADVEAFDAQLDYSLDSSFGAFDLYAIGTLQTHYKTQLTPTSAMIENVGFTSDSPLKMKANFGLNWRRGAWSAGWASRYFDSYLVINPAVANATNAARLISQGNEGRVSSQMYHDVFGSFRLSGDAIGFASDFLSSAEIRAGVTNVFDTEPPIDTTYINGYSTYGDPRLASYYVTFKVEF